MTDTDPTLDTFDTFPERPEGYDELRLTIVAQRPDPQDDAAVPGLETTGIVHDIMDAMRAVGADEDKVYVRFESIDAESAPIVSLAAVEEWLNAIEAEQSGGGSEPEPEPVEPPSTPLPGNE